MQPRYLWGSRIDEEEPLLRDFDQWLASKLELRSTMGWVGVISTTDPSERNVHTFFRRFDEFLRETGRCSEGLGEPARGERA